jgi:gliding motility-associated protein GldM
MALPKEPRQKMINIMYLVLTALLALNVSSEILNAFKVVDKSLQSSNTNIDGANKTLYSSLSDKVADPQTREKATIWNNHAQTAQKLSADFATYIDGLKKQLKEEAGLTFEAGKEKFKEDDLEAATRLFGNEEGGKNLGVELERKLKEYRVAMLAITPEIGKEFATSLAVDNAPVTGQDGEKKDFTNAYFHMTPTVAGLTLLSKFQNNVKNSENQVVTYCHEQIGKVKVKFDKAAVLVGQSSDYVMPGQDVTITAGVGAFSSQAQPRITINGGSPTMENGVGKYTFKADGSGKKTVSISVNYVDQDGNPKSENKTVEYTVGTPGGAAVMLDKMNVFYIGVDNPVTIGSPTGWDKTNVTMNGGSISGSGSVRTVRVSSLGPASITVTADGKPSTFNYRTKRIPDPVFKVGSGKKRVAAVEFKNQQFCRADLGDDFLFDLKFNVVSATVIFSGANFPTYQQGTISGNGLGSVASLIAKCGPGSAITFVNIKVQGPDGVRTIDEQGYTLY